MDDERIGRPSDPGDDAFAHDPAPVRGNVAHRHETVDQVHAVARHRELAGERIHHGFRHGNHARRHRQQLPGTLVGEGELTAGHRGG